MQKAQVKMFETVGVLVVFFILLGIGAVVYFGVQSSSLEREAARAQEQYAFQIVLKSLYFPELDCSFLVTQKDNCIDKIKLERLSKQIREKEAVKSDYFTEFGYSTITVSEEFPSANTWTLYENTPPDYSDILVTQSPILLYDAWQDTYAFGVIEVSVYVE